MIRLVCLILAIFAATKVPGALDGLASYLSRSTVARYEAAVNIATPRHVPAVPSCTPMPRSGSEQMRAYLDGVELCK